MTEPSKELPKEAPKAQPGDFHVAEYVRNVWRHHPAVGITKDHLLDPAYWAIISRQLKPGDVIECFAQDGTYFAPFLVLAAERTYAKVHVLAWHALTTADVAQTQDSLFKVEYKGPSLRYCVIRVADGEKVHTGSQTRKEAETWLDERLEQLTA